MDRMFLIVVDAHSKWPEVFTVKQATSAQTVDMLRTLFSRTGLPQQLVSANASIFTGEEFQKFIRKNGVKHITSTPHHPATKGLAERFVQSFKQSMKASGKEGTLLPQKVANFLLAYQNSARYNRTEPSDAVHGQEPEIAFGFAEARHSQTCTGKAVYKWTDTKTTDYI